MDHRYSYSQDNDDGYGGQVVYGEQEDVGQYADDQSQDDMDVHAIHFSKFDYAARKRFGLGRQGNGPAESDPNIILGSEELAFRLHGGVAAPTGEINRAMQGIIHELRTDDDEVVSNAAERMLPPPAISPQRHHQTTPYHHQQQLQYLEIPAAGQSANINAHAHAGGGNNIIKGGIQVDEELLQAFESHQPVKPISPGSGHRRRQQHQQQQQHHQQHAPPRTSRFAPSSHLTAAPHINFDTAAGATATTTTPGCFTVPEAATAGAGGGNNPLASLLASARTRQPQPPPPSQVVTAATAGGLSRLGGGLGGLGRTPLPATPATAAAAATTGGGHQRQVHHRQHVATKFRQPALGTPLRPAAAAGGFGSGGDHRRHQLQDAEMVITNEDEILTSEEEEDYLRTVASGSGGTRSNKRHAFQIDTSSLLQSAADGDLVAAALPETEEQQLDEEEEEEYGAGITPLPRRPATTTTPRYTVGGDDRIGGGGGGGNSATTTIGGGQQDHFLHGIAPPTVRAPRHTPRIGATASGLCGRLHRVQAADESTAAAASAVVATASGTLDLLIVRREVESGVIKVRGLVDRQSTVLLFGERQARKGELQPGKRIKVSKPWRSIPNPQSPSAKLFVCSGNVEIVNSVSP